MSKVKVKVKVTTINKHKTWQILYRQTFYKQNHYEINTDDAVQW